MSCSTSWRRRSRASSSTIDENTAWALGVALREAALAAALPVAISIRRNGQRQHGGITERVLQASAASYVVSPAAVSEATTGVRAYLFSADAADYVRERSRPGSGDRALRRVRALKLGLSVRFQGPEASQTPSPRTSGKARVDAEREGSASPRLRSSHPLAAPHPD